MGQLTSTAAAAELGVSDSRIRQLIREGRLPAKKLGRDWVVEEKDLKRLKNRKTGRPAKKKK